MYKQKCILWNDIKKKSIRKREKKNLSHLKFGSDKTVKALIQVFCTNAPINDALEFTSRELLQNCFVSKIFWIEKNFDPIYRIYVDLKKKNSIDNFESQNKNCPFIFDTIKTCR